MKLFKAAIALLSVACLCVGLAFSYAENLPGNDVDPASEHTYYIAMGFGSDPSNNITDREKVIIRNDTAKLYLQTYLKHSAGAGKKAIIADMQKKGDFSDFDCAKDAGFQQAADCIAQIKYQRLANGVRYSEWVRQFLRKLETRLPQTGTTELCFAEIRDPLYCGQSHENVEMLTQLLNENAGLTLRFLFVLDPEEPEPQEGQKRLADWMLEAFPKRVQICSFAPGEYVKAYTDAMTHANAARTAVACELVERPLPDETRTSWRMTYTHHPWYEHDDALLQLTGDLNNRDIAVEVYRVTPVEPDGEAPQTSVPQDGETRSVNNDHQSGPNSGTADDAEASSEEALSLTVEPEASVEPGASAEPGASVEPQAEARELIANAECTVLEHQIMVYLPALEEGEYEVVICYPTAPKQEPQVRLQSYLLVSNKRFFENVSVSLPEEVERDDQPVEVKMGSHSGLQDWKARMYLEGTAVAGGATEPIAPASQENEGGVYSWVFQLPASRFVPGQLALRVEMWPKEQEAVVFTWESTVKVVNRAPRLVDGSELVRNAYVNVPGRDAENVRIPLNELVVDDDGDELTFALDSFKLWNRLSKSRWGNLHFEDNGRILIYQPLQEECAGLAQAVMSVNDGLGGSTNITLAFNQYDITRQLQSLRLVNHSGDALSGVLGSENTVLFTLEAASQQAADVLRQYAESTNRMPELFPVLSFECVDQKTQEKKEVKLLPLEDGQPIGFAVVLPPADVEAEYVLTLNKAPMILGLPLPDLLSTAPDGSVFHMTIQNQPPTLAEGIEETIVLSAVELNDFLQEKPSMSLAEALKRTDGVKPSEWFRDEDSKDENGRSLLRYTLEAVADPGDGLSVFQAGQPIPPQTGLQEGSSVYVLDGEQPIDVSFQKSGRYALTFAAEDGNGEAKYSIQLEVTSKTKRVLILAGIIALTLALVVAVVLIVVQACKPAFGSLQAGLYLAEKQTVEGLPAPTVFLPMRAYRKNETPLLTIALACQQPLPNAEMVAAIRDMRLKPGKGSTLAVLKVNKKETVYVYENGGWRVLDGGSLALRNQVTVLGVHGTILKLMLTHNEIGREMVL